MNPFSSWTLLIVKFDVNRLENQPMEKLSCRGTILWEGVALEWAPNGLIIWEIKIRCPLVHVFTYLVRLKLSQL